MNCTMAYIDERLQGMIRAPKTFGGQEARELQTILLLELRAATLGRIDNTRVNLVRFIRENVDESCSASPLNVRSLPDTLFDKLLSQFIREQISFQDAG